MRSAAAFACLALLITAAAAFAGAADPGTGSVSGRIFFEDGTGASSARLVFLPGGWNVTAAADGSFATTLPAGNYTLRVSGGGTVSESNVVVRGGEPTVVIVRLDRTGGVAPGSTAFPVLFLVASMIAVAVGGFFVNRRMAETGIDINKSIIGGANPRKPFRRRRKKAPPSG